MPEPGRVHEVCAFFAHHQGMSLVALTNAVLGAPMVRRFHADPRVRATEPLLQERVPRFVPVIRPRPPESTRVEPPAVAASPRRFRSPHTLYPSTHFLSNGQYTAIVTNAGGGASSWRGHAVTRQRDDATCDPGSQFIYLRDVRSGQLWSAAYQPVCRESERYRVTFLPDEALFERTDEGIETRLQVTVSPEDDVEVRRISLINHSDLLREIEVTSLVEIVLAPHAEDLAHPAFLKLFLETEYRPECMALLCGRRPRSPDELAPWAIHVMSAEGGGHGAIEWETDRARFIGRGRTPEDPIALDGRALSGTTGAVLDPVLSLRRRVRIAPGRGASRVCDRRRDEQGCGDRAGREVRRLRRGRSHLRARHHPDPDATPPSRNLDGRSAALRAPRVARPVDRRHTASLARRSSRPTRSASPACGRTASPAICRR